MVSQKILASLFVLLLLVKFTNPFGGTNTYVNPEEVEAVTVMSGGTLNGMTVIALTSGETVAVKESVDVVAKKLQVRDGQ